MAFEKSPFYLSSSFYNLPTHSSEWSEITDMWLTVLPSVQCVTNLSCTEAHQGLWYWGRYPDVRRLCSIYQYNLYVSNWQSRQRLVIQWVCSISLKCVDYLFKYKNDYSNKVRVVSRNHNYFTVKSKMFKVLKENLKWEFPFSPVVLMHTLNPSI